MDDSLLDYYEKELTFVRKMGAEFARKYPKIAGRLLLEADKCEDPHTERLIEAFAFLSGRIHKKINDDFPEITQSLLNILYPHYLNPVPSMTIVRFDPAPKTITPSGYHVPRHTSLYSQPVGGIPCQFSTCYPTDIWPVEVTGVEMRDPWRAVEGAQQVLGIRLKTYEHIRISELAWDSVRFFLNGPPQHVHHLYELLFNHVCQVEAESTKKDGKPIWIPLGRDSLQSVGFETDEGMIPYTERSFPGYRLLFEYFSFPEKFLFFRLASLDQLRRMDLGDSLTFWIHLNRMPKTNLVLGPETFCLNATPAVNLFTRIAEPIRVEQHKTEYQVIPDIRRLAGAEVFSVDRVTASPPSTPGKVVEFKPFYSIQHHLDEELEDAAGAFWHIQRKPSGRKDDDGTEVYLSFSDLDFTPVDPAVEILTIHCTCTNRDLPARLPFGNPAGDFDVEMAAPVSRIVSMIKPTPTRRLNLEGGLNWHLISHLSLNYLSLVEGGEEALKEILKLYDMENSPATRQQINGIVSIRTEHITKRIGRAFARGVQTTLELDEDKFVGAGLYLFASVLERFLGQYVSVNSFSQLVLRTEQRKEPLKRWPPRSGNRILL
ncbi:MAG: type VI secretion system baseplate subunit TssF [Deltaproteobacteria bacterium]|nr:type VI secretion system baseplate subunit TssF [Deltaproteobacteria bacterium]